MQNILHQCHYFLVLILILVLSDGIAEGFTIERARLRNGDLRLEGSGARPNSPITVDGIRVGESERDDCIGLISDGRTNVTVTFEDCTPTSGTSTTGGGCTSPCCDATGSRSISLGSASYSVAWNITCSDTMIRFMVTASTTGISLTDENLLHLHYQQGTTGTVTDRWATGRSQPGIDTTNNLMDAGASESSGVTSMWFSRLLNTGDTTQDMELKPGPMYLLLAIGSSDNTGNEHSQKTAILVDLFGGAIVVPTAGSGTLSTSSGGITPPPSGEGECSGTLTQSLELKPGYVAEWFIDCEAETITWTLTVQTIGWVGLGFGNTPEMPNADVIMAFVDDTTGEVQISDRYTTDRIAPHADTGNGGADDFTNPSGTQDATSTKVSFTRPFKTNDPNDFVVSPGTKVFLLYAWRSIDDNIGSIHTDKGVLEIDLFSGEAQAVVQEFNLKGIHGVLMIIAWAFTVIIAQYLARYLKNIGHTWFQLHRLLNIIALLCTLVGFVLILVFMNGTFAAAPHHIIGLLVIAGSIAQPILGTLADKMWSPDKLHWWVGRATILLGFVNIYLGFCEYQAHLAVWIVYSAWLAALITLYVFSELKLGAVHHNNSAETKEMEMKRRSTNFRNSIQTSVKELKEPQGCWEKNRKALTVFLTFNFIGIFLMGLLIALLALLPADAVCVLPRA